MRHSGQVPKQPSRHPLATTQAVTIDLEYDAAAKSFVTFVRELHRMSTFGQTEAKALDNTAEMIRAYIQAMQANRLRIPLTVAKLAELGRVVGLP